MFAVLVTGPPGAGKTATLIALSDALVDDGIAHAALDADEVAWAFPSPDEARRRELLGAAAGAHRADGHELLLVAEVVETDADAAALLAAVGAGEHLLVRLDAPVELLRERIVAREPPGWSGLEHLLGEAERGLGELEGALVLSTEEMTSSAIAERIRAARPDVLGGPRTRAPAKRRRFAGG